jgi:hypothetical protein
MPAGWSASGSGWFDTSTSTTGGTRSRRAGEGPRHIVDAGEWRNPTWRYPGFDSVDFGVELETEPGSVFSVTWDPLGMYEGIGLREQPLLGTGCGRMPRWQCGTSPAAAAGPTCGAPRSSTCGRTTSRGTNTRAATGVPVSRSPSCLRPWTFCLATPDPPATGPVSRQHRHRVRPQPVDITRTLGLAAAPPSGPA